MKVQTGVLCATMVAMLIQSTWDGTPALVVGFRATLATISVCLAIATMFNDPNTLLVKALAILLWGGKISLMAAFALGYAPPPVDLFLHQGMVMYMHTFVNVTVLTNLSSRLLPMWLLLALAQVHALALYNAIPARQPLLHLILCHLAVLVLPTFVVQRSRMLSNRHENLSTCATCSQDTSTVVKAKVPHVYVPVLGERRKVCIKIATHHHPMGMQQGSLDRLARVIERAGGDHIGSTAISTTHGPRVVLNAAVRHGCILINLDMHMEPICSDDVLDWAQHLLPCVLNELGLTDAYGCELVMLEPGQYLSMQVGDRLVHATTDPQTKKWLFSMRPVQSGGNCGVPTLALALPISTMQEPIVHHYYPSETYTVSFQVLMTCHGDGSALQLISGSDPQTTMLPAQSPAEDSPRTGCDGSKPELQLWVHSQGQYLHTSVQPAVVSSDMHACSATIQAQVQLPVGALARHHQPAGPVARLQLLTAELWAGDVLLSSTPLLLDAEQHTQPPLSCTFGWWGVPAGPAAGMVHEVAALATRAAADAQMSTYQAFVSDLSAWLVRMQEAAPGTCCDMCEAPAAPVSGLSLQHCQALSHSLQGHAAASGAPCTQSVLRRQHAVLLGTWQDANSEHNGGNPAAVLWRCFMLLCTWFTYLRPCPECDAMYYQRLREYLQNVWMYASVFRIITRMIVVAQEIRGGGGGGAMPAFGFSCIFSMCIALHTLGLLSNRLYAAKPDGGANHLARSSWPSKCKQWLVHAGRCHALAWCLRLAFTVGVALHIVKVPGIICRSGSSFTPLIFTDVLFTVFTEQTWGRLPDLAIRHMLFAEAVSYSKAQSQCPNHVSTQASSVALYLMCFLLPPLLLDLYWRRLLRPSHAVLGTCSTRPVKAPKPEDHACARHLHLE